MHALSLADGAKISSSSLCRSLGVPTPKLRLQISYSCRHGEYHKTSRTLQLTIPNPLVIPHSALHNIYRWYSVIKKEEIKQD